MINIQSWIITVWIHLAGIDSSAAMNRSSRKYLQLDPGQLLQASIVI